MSMARAFAAAGAGTVIASLWDAGDAESAALFKRFYARMAGGAAPPEALRLAQIDLLRSKPFSHPRSWAAYQIHGGA